MVNSPTTPSNSQFDSPTDPRISDRFENIDTDRNNIINFTEFYNHQTNTFLKPTEEQSGQTFLKYDSDTVGSYRLRTWTREEHGRWYSALYNTSF